jgi:glycosyltransferase involved in cell wall biosynthesis
MTLSSSPGDSTSCCFLNPFANHSYFTVLALARCTNVYFFCPPLQIQFILQRWRHSDIPHHHEPFTARLAHFLAILAFLCFRVNLISHDLYLYLFRNLLCLFLRQLTSCSIFIFYQDYVAKFLASKYPNSIRICELIIATDPKQANYSSTLDAILSSSIIITPSPSLQNIVSPLHSTSFIAPYGGNKIIYQSSYSSYLDCPTPYTPIRFRNSDTVITHFRIAARAHSYRKGGDILLQALLLLDRMICKLSLPIFVDFFICGSISELAIRTQFHNVAHCLNQSNHIRLHNQQLEQSQFSNMLSSCDLFVMPSRLESTSLAALEALWHGVPSILTPACGVDDFIHDRHGTLLDDLTPLGLASSLILYFTNPTLIENCRIHLTQDRPIFTWNRYFDSYKRVLQLIHQ